MKDSFQSTYFTLVCKKFSVPGQLLLKSSPSYCVRITSLLHNHNRISDSQHLPDDRNLSIRPNQSYVTTPSRSVTNESLAQIGNDDTNYLEATPVEYSKLDQAYEVIVSREEVGRAERGKIVVKERYEFAEIKVPDGDVMDDAKYEVPADVGRKAASENYAHLKH